MRSLKYMTVAVAAATLLLAQAPTAFAADHGKSGSAPSGKADSAQVSSPDKGKDVDHSSNGKNDQVESAAPESKSDDTVLPGSEVQPVDKGHGKGQQADTATAQDAAATTSDAAATTSDAAATTSDAAQTGAAKAEAAKAKVDQVKAASREAAKTEREKGATGAYLIYVNGARVNLTPLAHNGRTLVPFRALAENLGATVSWEPSTRTVTMVKGDTTVVITIGATTATVNGQTVELAVPAEINDGSTFVPLRFIAEALGADVDYDANTGAITVIKLPAAGTTTPTDGTTTPTDGTTTAPATGTDTGSTTTAPATGTDTGSTTTAPATGTDTGSTTTAPATGTDTGSTTTAPATGTDTGSTTTAP